MTNVLSMQVFWQTVPNSTEGFAEAETL